jgi:hypothetical protein
VLAVSSFLRQGSPETPGNAVLDFGNHVVLGEYDAAWDRLCSSTKASALGNGDAFVSVRSFMAHVGSISTNYGTKIDGDKAIEPVTMRPRGAPDDRATSYGWCTSPVKVASGVCAQSSRRTRSADLALSRLHAEPPLTGRASGAPSGDEAR